MFHLSIIIADLGRFASLGGTVVRTSATIVVIEDHHLRPAERVAFIARHINLDEIIGTDVTVLTDVTINCAAGVHEWTVDEMQPDSSVDVRCVRCDTRDHTSCIPHWNGDVVRAPRMFYPPPRGRVAHGMG